jgi:hypothetical protein
MSGSKSYRDDYADRGKYAKENDAMLASESARTLDWQTQALGSPLGLLRWVCLGGLLLASAVAVVLYVFVIGLE